MAPPRHQTPAARGRLLLQRRRSLLAAALGLLWLPQAARATCTVAGLANVVNGMLGSACQPFATLADGALCAITCHAGYTLSGQQPSCTNTGTGSVFDAGSVACSGQPCLLDPVIDGIASTATECEELPHGTVCAYSCVAGLRPHAPASTPVHTTTCDAGNYGSSSAGTALCQEIDACVDFPCPLPVSETCADILYSATPVGINDSAGRTCTGNPCTAQTTSSLAGQGYEAATPTATTVATLGNIGCASGFMRAGDRSVAPTASCATNDAGQTPLTFQLTGCVASACTGTPAFLEGFDLTGVTPPPRPSDSAVSSGLTCLPDRLPSGAVALTVSCDLNGDFQLDNSAASNRKVCAPCTVVLHAAVEACTYTIPPVPAVGTAALSDEATTDLIELCAAVDISGTDATADETACTSAGTGSPCSYTPEEGAPQIFAVGTPKLYECTSATDSRVTACKPGYYKTFGNPDVSATTNTVESTNDVCTPCVSVENAANGAITSCTTAYDTRASGCAAEFYRNQGVTERCDGTSVASCTETAGASVAADLATCTATGMDVTTNAACIAVKLDCASGTTGSCPAGCADDGNLCSGASTDSACTYAAASVDGDATDTTCEALTLNGNVATCTHASAAGTMTAAMTLDEDASRLTDFYAGWTIVVTGAGAGTHTVTAYNAVTRVITASGLSGTGTTSVYTLTAGPCTHTEGTPDTCIACVRVVDALDGVVQNCTMANDTRVSECKATYVLVRGAGGTSPVPDTCWSTPPSVSITYTGSYTSITATPAAFKSFTETFKNKMSEFLTIPTRRIVVTAVVSSTRRMLQAGSGSIVVYFYLGVASARAPLNEYTPAEAYVYLTSSASSGTLALQFQGASFLATLVMPVDVPTGYQPPPPPPPPIICAEVIERNGCLESGCAW